MSRVSSAFGDMIKSFLQRNGLTFRAAAFMSSISAAYWKDMSDGRVPSEEVIVKIAGCFDDLDENDLRTAAGYAPDPSKMDVVKAVEFALRGQESIPEDGKKQILSFVKQMEELYGVKGNE
ncbi:MAG: helix-turn-helix domain-containing protein [Armatimonadota bacterium]